MHKALTAISCAESFEFLAQLLCRRAGAWHFLETSLYLLSAINAADFAQIRVENHRLRAQDRNGIQQPGGLPVVVAEIEGSMACKKVPCVALLSNHWYIKQEQKHLSCHVNT